MEDLTPFERDTSILSFLNKNPWVYQYGYYEGLWILLDIFGDEYYFNTLEELYTKAKEIYEQHYRPPSPSGWEEN